MRNPGASRGDGRPLLQEAAIAVGRAHGHLASASARALAIAPALAGMSAGPPTAGRPALLFKWKLAN